MHVTAYLIVERLDVLGHLCCCQISVLVDSLFDVFLLQAAEERLGNGIIPTVTSSTHTGLELVGATEAPPIVTAILTALVRMNDRSTGPPSSHRHHDSIPYELAMDSRSSRPADDFSGKQIHDDGEVEPSLLGANIGYP